MKLEIILENIQLLCVYDNRFFSQSENITYFDAFHFLQFTPIDWQISIKRTDFRRGMYQIRVLS